MNHKRILLTIIIILSFLSYNFEVIAQQNEDIGAELSILPDIPQIPQITPNKKNTIPLMYTDNFGMNWTTLQYMYGDEGIGRILSFFITRVVWPIIHPLWVPLLGYTRVVIDTEIVGNPEGWSASVTPTSITKSTDGTMSKLNLEVYVDDFAAENTVTVRISATRYSKVGEELGTSYFEIPLRSENLEYFYIKPIDQHQTVAPDSIVYYQIEVTNLGYFIDTFAARITTDKDTRAILTEQSMVLYPGETKIVTLQVMTPDDIFDPGTIRTINITGYSIANSEFETYAQVQVKTQGFYFSPLLAFALLIILIIVAILYISYQRFYTSKEKSLYGKPEKPWNISKEREYLTKLKKKNPEKYQQEIKMMRDEYQSALHWYESYKQSLRPSKTKFSVSNIFNKIKSLTSHRKEALEEKKKEPDTPDKPEISKSTIGEKTTDVFKKPEHDAEVSSQSEKISRSQKISGFFSSIKKVVTTDEKESKEKPPVEFKEFEPVKPVEEPSEQKPVIDEKALAKKQKNDAKVKKLRQVEQKIRKAQAKQQKKHG